MQRPPWKILVFFTVIHGLLSGCATDDGSKPSTSSRGEVLFTEPVEGGNSFACATCHAIEEPTSDGIRRPGHPLADATVRATYKNGQLTELRDAVNSCLDEWMNAAPLADGSDEWNALFEYMDSFAPESTNDLSYEIVAPPTVLTGGDADAGRSAFNSTCAVFHGVDAAGTNQGPGFTIFKPDADEIAKRVRTSGRATSGVYQGLTGGIMPFWSKERLSDQELVDIIAYIDFIEMQSNGGNNNGGNNGGNNNGGNSNCGANHPKVGQTASLSTLSHGVSGTAEIVDDCTIEIKNFVYDGGGIDVRVYAGKDGSFFEPKGFAITDDIFGTVYSGMTLTATLPQGKTLDDLDSVSIWCTDVGVSFGDGVFQ